MVELKGKEKTKEILIKNLLGRRSGVRCRAEDWWSFSISHIIG
jgi:hypothetical protein